MSRMLPMALFAGLVSFFVAEAAGQSTDARLQKMLERFPAADADGDGTLTLQEAKAFRQQQRPKRTAKPPKASVPKSPMKRYSVEEMSNLYEAHEFNGVPYRLFKPKGFDSEAGKKFPLVLSLHGAGGKGNDNRKNLKPWNGVLTEPSFQKEHPCFVVAPQSIAPWRAPDSVPELTDELIAEFSKPWQRFLAGRKSFASSESVARRNQGKEVLHHVFELLDSLETQYPIDSDRVYVLGHSMGGVGSFECVATAPGRFAAAIPSAGGLAPWHDPSRFAKVPVWAFHGDKDPTVPIALSRWVFDEMKRLGGNMKLTTLANVQHGASAFAFVYTGDEMAKGFKTEQSSDQCDPTPDVWDWLFAQKRP